MNNKYQTLCAEINNPNTTYNKIISTKPKLFTNKGTQLSNGIERASKNLVNGASNWGQGNRGGSSSNGDAQSKFGCTAGPDTPLSSQTFRPTVNVS